MGGRFAENPEKNTVYIIGGRKHPFYAAVSCPRQHCRQIIHLDVVSTGDQKVAHNGAFEWPDLSIALGPCDGSSLRMSLLVTKGTNCLERSPPSLCAGKKQA